MLRSRKQRTVETVITRQMAFVQPTTVDGSAVAKGTLQGISGYDEKYPQVAKVSSNRGNKTHAFLELPIDPLSTWRETSFIPLYPKSSRAERVRKALPDLFELIPEQGYMSTLKNPCFMGYGRLVCFMSRQACLHELYPATRCNGVHTFSSHDYLW